MNEGRIPVRYAKALFETALSRNMLDRVSEDMLYVGEACRLDQIRELLKSPVIKPSRKNKVLADLFKKDVSELTLSLIGLMIKNGRESFLPSVSRILRDQTLRHKGVTESNLTTAVPADDGIKRSVEDFISRKFKTKALLKETVDPEIIGGFVLKVDDYFIDASLRTKLRKIRKKLSGKMH